ncbi:hypothetical protein ACS0VU_09450 [Aliiroseovarius sp. KMU-71]|uniref:hypothetical protein n=1 Tax=Aliiroseovarius sp. KMU-71 TaxID=3453123 RepID=UPI003F48BC38
MSKTILIEAADYKYQNCEFTWNSVSTGEKRTKTTKFDDGSFAVEVDDFITEFSFKPDRRILGSPIITGVRAEGFLMDDFVHSRERIYRIDSLKKSAISAAVATIEQAETKAEEMANSVSRIKELESEAAGLKGEIENTERELAHRRNEVSELDARISEKKAEQSGLEARIEKQQATIEQRQAERDSLTREIAEKSGVLSELESDIYLFPSEISEFVKQGGKNKAFYWKLAVVPMLVLVGMAIALLTNAANLSTVFDEVENARIFSILVTRIPYVVVASTIIGVSFAMIQRLISEIFRIDKQTRSLAKISIVATDVYEASADGLNLSDTDQYQLRTALKMELLREHLKDYVPEDYEYSARKSVFEKVRERKETLADSEAEDESLVSVVDD